MLLQTFCQGSMVCSTPPPPNPFGVRVEGGVGGGGGYLKDYALNTPPWWRRCGRKLLTAWTEIWTHTLTNQNPASFATGHALSQQPQTTEVRITDL